MNTKKVEGNDGYITWSQLAEKYGQFKSNEYSIEPTLESIFSELNINGKKVLDDGCGIGIFADRLSKKFRAKVTGVDLSREMINIARKSDSDVKYVVGDATRLSFESGTFDYVLSCTMLPNIPTDSGIKLAIAEMSRVLVTNGKLIVLIPHPNNDHLVSLGIREPLNHPDSFAQGESFKLRLYKTDGTFVDVTNYHYSLQTYLDAITSSGLKIQKQFGISAGSHIEDDTPPAYLIIIASKTVRG